MIISMIELGGRAERELFGKQIMFLVCFFYFFQKKIGRGEMKGRFSCEDLKRRKGLGLQDNFLFPSFAGGGLPSDGWGF